MDATAKDQALGVERRASMQRSADSIYARLDGHDRDLDRILAWQNRAELIGALRLCSLGRVSRIVSVADRGSSQARPWAPTSARVPR